MDDGIENPEYKRVFDASFFKTMEGNYLDDMLNWLEDFSKRMADAESEQPKEELDFEAKKLIDAGWTAQQNESGFPNA